MTRPLPRARTHRNAHKPQRHPHHHPQCGALIAQKQKGTQERENGNGPAQQPRHTGGQQCRPCHEPIVVKRRGQHRHHRKMRQMTQLRTVDHPRPPGHEGQRQKTEQHPQKLGLRRRDQGRGPLHENEIRTPDHPQGKQGSIGRQKRHDRKPDRAMTDALIVSAGAPAVARDLRRVDCRKTTASQPCP